VRDWKALYRTEGETFYSPMVVDHFQNPRRVGRLDADDGKGCCGDPACGDFLEITIAVDDEKPCLTDVRFLIHGCPAAVAVGSVTAEMACGLDLEAAENLTEDAVIRALGGLPEAKKHCSMLSIGALQVALADYRRRQEMLTAGLIESKEEYRRRRDELNRPASSTGDEGE